MNKIIAHNGEAHIKLPGASSGGYLWGVQNLDSQLKITVYDDDVEIPKDVIGYNSNFCAKIESENLGIFKVEFVLKRPWEPKPTRIVTFEIDFRSS